MLRDTVIAAKAGDRSALERILLQHLDPLRAFVRVRAGAVVVERESVDDLVQSVCREALADLDEIEYHADPQFRAWLFLLATRKILDRKKHLLRDRRDVSRERSFAAESEVELLGAFAGLATPSRVASAREELDRIEGAVRELPDNQRDAVAYVRLLGLSYPDVAARMEMSESAVRGLVARGLATIAEQLRGTQED